MQGDHIHSDWEVCSTGSNVKIGSLACNARMQRQARWADRGLRSWPLWHPKPMRNSTMVPVSRASLALVNHFGFSSSVRVTARGGLALGLGPMGRRPMWSLAPHANWARMGLPK